MGDDSGTVDAIAVRWVRFLDFDACGGSKNPGRRCAVPRRGGREQRWVRFHESIARWVRFSNSTARWVRFPKSTAWWVRFHQSIARWVRFAELGAGRCGCELY